MAEDLVDQLGRRRDLAAIGLGDEARDRMRDVRPRLERLAQHELDEARVPVRLHAPDAGADEITDIGEIAVGRLRRDTGIGRRHLEVQFVEGAGQQHQPVGRIQQPLDGLPRAGLLRRDAKISRGLMFEILLDSL